MYADILILFCDDIHVVLDHYLNLPEMGASVCITLVGKEDLMPHPTLARAASDCFDSMTRMQILFE